MNNKELNLRYIVNDTFDKADLSLMGTIIIFSIIIGMIFIGMGVFNLKNPSSSRLGKVYFGAFIMIVVAFLSAYNGYIPW